MEPVRYIDRTTDYYRSQGYDNSCSRVLLSTSKLKFPTYSFLPIMISYVM